jgi:hypothetical protein
MASQKTIGGLQSDLQHGKEANADLIGKLKLTTAHQQKEAELTALIDGLKNEKAKHDVQVKDLAAREAVMAAELKDLKSELSTQTLELTSLIQKSKFDEREWQRKEESLREELV